MSATDPKPGDKSDAPPRDDFFIGYLGRLPRALRAVIPMAAIGLLVGFVGGAFAVAVTTDDPGPRRFQAIDATGVLVAEPYPHLRVPPSDDAPLGRTYVLTRLPNKLGVQDAAAEMDGELVRVRGQRSFRGDVEMVQVGVRRGRPRIELAEAGGEAALTPVEDLGRWRLSGEICDGKCYTGAMRPGNGLAHKACANLCIISGTPPLFVTAEPVAPLEGEPTEGADFLLVAGPEGGPMDEALYAVTGVLIEAEGRLERHGDLLIFYLEPDSVRPI